MLQMVGAVVEDDGEEGHMLSTVMNMTQLAFIKRLESVERVKKSIYTTTVIGFPIARKRSMVCFVPRDEPFQKAIPTSA